MLRVEKATKSFGDRRLFEGVSFQLDAGEHALIQGVSGVGKSTLLNCIARLERLDSGEVFFGSEAIEKLGPAAQFRLQNIGMVFQEIHLVESLSVWQNLDLLARASRSGADVGKLLDVFGLSSFAQKSVRLLSRGERQRVGIARALVNLPKLVLADEPTSSLDPERRTECLSRLWEWCSSHNTSVVMVSHDLMVMESGVFSHKIALP